MCVCVCVCVCDLSSHSHSVFDINFEFPFSPGPAEGLARGADVIIIVYFTKRLSLKRSVQWASDGHCLKPC